jgi:hypothetical protein
MIGVSDRAAIADVPVRRTARPSVVNRVRSFTVGGPRLSDHSCLVSRSMASAALKACSSILLWRMEAEARTRQAQLIGPIQFGAWARNIDMNKDQVSPSPGDGFMKRDSLYRGRGLQQHQLSEINSGREQDLPVLLDVLAPALTHHSISSSRAS